MHRLVVLPDYQGIGVGTSLLDWVAGYYRAQGWDVNIATSTPALSKTLRRRSEWVMRGYGRRSNFRCFAKYGKKTDAKRMGKSLVEASSRGRNIYSFNYRGHD